MPYTFNKRYILLAALIYLLLPNILLLWGWYRLSIAIPITILCGWGAYSWFKSVKSTTTASSALICSSQDCISLCIALLCALLLTESIGFHAHSMQPSDFLVRTPIYQTLIAQPWPLYTQSGDYFIYYHAFWLPPALASKFIGNLVSPNTILFVWCYIGLSISILLLFSKIKGRILPFCGIFFLLGTIVPDIGHVIAYVTKSHWEHISDLMWATGLEGYTGYVSLWTSVTQTYNSSIPALVCVSLLLSGMVPTRFFWLPAACIVAPTILCAGALFIWIVTKLLFRPKDIVASMRTPQTWIYAIFVILVMLYFMGQGGKDGGNGVHFVWDDIDIGKGRPPFERSIRALVLCFPLVTSMALIIGKRLCCNHVFRGAAAIATIIPFIWIGINNNEFLFKGSLVMFFLFSWLLTIRWNYADKKTKRILLIFLVASCMQLEREIHSRDLWDYGWSEETMKRHIYNPWNSSLEHPEHPYYERFFGKNKFPIILYSQPGEWSL